MLQKLTQALRLNTWLLMAAFAAFTASALVGHLTVDADSTTPAVWLAVMWAMLAAGTVIVVAVAIECLMAMMQD
ncbi:MAG: hypothetical protein K8I82_09355 [Anaerolineae bacterium]|nr:hypothetical protein [Anaerolineae bacterium]